MKQLIRSSLIGVTSILFLFGIRQLLSGDSQSGGLVVGALFIVWISWLLSGFFQPNERPIMANISLEGLFYFSAFTLLIMAWVPTLNGAPFFTHFTQTIQPLDMPSQTVVHILLIGLILSGLAALIRGANKGFK
jgi:cytochrome bd-type quinol oxidase subunit 2